MEIPCSVINVASGHESESNLDKQLLDSLEGDIGDGQHGLGTFQSRIFKKYTILVGGLEHFLFFPIVGMMIQSD